MIWYDVMWCDMIWYDILYMCVCCHILLLKLKQVCRWIFTRVFLCLSLCVKETEIKKEKRKNERKTEDRGRERERKVHLKCMLKVTCSPNQDVHWSAVSQRLKASINNHTPRSDCLLAGIRPAGVTQFNNSETTSKSFRPRASTAVQTVCNDLFKRTAFDAALLNFASKLNLGVARNNKNRI